MKVRCQEALPRNFSGHSKGGKILAETDIAIRGHDSPRAIGRLRAKLLVFRTRRDMHAFSRDALGVNNNCAVGFVHELYREVINLKGDGKREHIAYVDPRYFALICLVQGHLTMEVITHEACHAGIYFSQRSRHQWPNQKHAPSEAICYPTGRIASAINRFLHDKGLYE